jgi:hypothetical protein
MTTQTCTPARNDSTPDDDRPGLSTASMSALLDRAGASATAPDAPLWVDGVDPAVWSRAVEAYRQALIGPGPLAGYADIGFDDCVALLDAAGVEVRQVRQVRQVVPVPAGAV